MGTGGQDSCTTDTAWCPVAVAMRKRATSGSWTTPEGAETYAARRSSWITPPARSRRRTRNRSRLVTPSGSGRRGAAWFSVRCGRACCRNPRTRAERSSGGAGSRSTSGPATHAGSFPGHEPAVQGSGAVSVPVACPNGGATADSPRFSQVSAGWHERSVQMNLPFGRTGLSFRS
jgi:hypothetical protein